MAYLIEHLEDGDVCLENEVDKEDSRRISRAQAQAEHEATAAVCGGGRDCLCYQAGYDEGYDYGLKDGQTEE